MYIASNGRKRYSREMPTLEDASKDVGVARERVQLATLEAIEKLFPSPMNGIEFLGLVLRYATIKQLTLPSFAQEQSFAVITVKNIRVLSKLIGWSYDTTHKYVALFCALGFFVKGRRQHQVELYFPLDSYVPPESLAALDNLIAEYRPKVRQSAQQVKTRFLLYFSSPQTFFDKMGVPDELQPMLQEIRQLFQHEGVDSKKQQNLLVQIARVVQRVLPSKQFETVDTAQKSLSPPAHPILPSRQPEDQSSEQLSLKSNASTLKNRPSKSEKVDPSYKIPLSARPALPQEKSRPSTPESLMIDSKHQRVDSFPSSTPNVVDSKHQRVDSFSIPVSEKVDFSLLEVDSLEEQEEVMPKSRPLGVDFSHIQEQEGVFLAEKGDFSSLHSTQKVNPLDEKGDFSQKVASIAENQVDLNDLNNVNVNKIITNNLNNVNVKSLQTLAAFLGTILGEDRSKWGIYVVHLKQYSQPEAIIAALMKTLSCKFRDGSLHNPPAFFLARSKEYHVAIPADVHQLVDQYASLSYGQLIETLKQPASSSKEGHSQGDYQAKEIKSSALQVLKAPPLYIQLQSEQAHMSLQDATKLYKQLCNDSRMVLCKKFILPVDVEKTRYVLLLDVTVSNKVRQTFLYSQQEWYERSQNIRTCLSLFESSETLQRSQNRFAALRDLLKKKTP
ncbi:hypothetical protein Krac_5112 [Ktedonobacter racemifer DSM 44963]|uniref:Uncharacterized protein n=2 Tax=Ktedonobacter racemifer TaxID=363277 RepID=D6TUM6_KTERA|nr:hypothetical protein Krac_5112 [Ktedonobacter racemifer DSM 44963]